MDPLLASAHRWQQVLDRDPSARFVYAVRTTGIYCRPSCPSRRPVRANVEFFEDPEAAQRAGFRACLRCRPGRQSSESALVERLTAMLRQNLDRSISLSELAAVAGCSPGAVQRLFSRVLGLSPRAWANAERAERYRRLLANPATRITDAVYDAGFSGPSRAHAAAGLGMAARRYRAQGAGERIGYALGDAPGPLGRLLVAATGRGVCAVLLGDQDDELAADLASRFPRAELAFDTALAPHLAAVLAQIEEHPGAQELPLDLRGTTFQARVWAELRAIPRGSTTSYSHLAAAIGSPRAVRAVANACARNPAAIVVPCHRVIGADGRLTGYRWGLDRKRTLLALESEGLRAAEQDVPS
jgi:AraC family transcriptional regulator of adaptative response/methylated-DNA-[protein]-cysteine methyltransferase